MSSPYTVSRYLREVSVEPAAHPADLSWHDGALCAQASGDSWFPEEGQPAREVKAICRRCPVRESCLRWVLDRCEEGIWAGMSGRERRRAADLRRDGASLTQVIADCDARWDAALARSAEHNREAALSGARIRRAARAAARGESSPVPQPREKAAA